MKPTSTWLWLPLLSLFLIAGLSSWKGNPPQTTQASNNPADTLPKKKELNRERKVRDLDEAIDELDRVDMREEMGRARQEMEQSLQKLDVEKMKLDMEKAMKSVDLDKMKVELDKELSHLDIDKMKKEMKESIDRIDWDQMKKGLDEVKKIDFSKMEEEMKKAHAELDRIRPEMEKEMEHMKIDMEKAQQDLQKAKDELKEYKSFVDDLDSNGLIDKKKEYEIRIEDNELYINGKKASEETANKYRSFIEKHKKFTIKKSADDFDIKNDN